jgi:hypothetical protein
LVVFNYFSSTGSAVFSVFVSGSSKSAHNACGVITVNVLFWPLVASLLEVEVLLEFLLFHLSLWGGVKWWSASSYRGGLTWIGIIYQPIYRLTFFFLLLQSFLAGNLTLVESIWSSDYRSKLILLDISIDIKCTKRVSLFFACILLIIISHRPDISDAGLTWSGYFFGTSGCHLNV